jgi:hypothetical protein
MHTQSLEEEIVLFLSVDELHTMKFTWGNWVQGGKKLNIKILEAKWVDEHVHPQLLTSIQVARILECSNYYTSMYTWGSFLPSFRLVHLFLFKIFPHLTYFVRK